MAPLLIIVVGGGSGDALAAFVDAAIRDILVEVVGGDALADNQGQGNC